MSESDSNRSQAHADALVVWDYHQMHHQVRPTDVGIGLGSHDLGVADKAAEMYLNGLFKLLVFTGATSPTTAAVFPDGEAIAHAERAKFLGVPDEALLVESSARNTGDNFKLARDLLAENGIHPSSVTVICKPYMQRRAFATCRKVWPAVEVSCISDDLSYDDYVAAIGNEKLVIDMLVGDLQRVLIYPSQGFAIEQEVPPLVEEAYQRLVQAGFTSRLATVS